MGELAKRRSETLARISELQRRLGAAETLAKDKACVFATGSFGRREASSHSDLDVFIVGKKSGKAGADGKQGSVLGRLDEICIKADLIETIRALGIPDFTDGGHYLTHFSVHEFTKTLGTPHDDVTNTFTARLLLVLESCPILESNVYREVLDEVVAEYWRDYERHKSDFMPAFLANDILRLWRTFCVNYEARTKREPPEQEAKGKLKNYKLKHSRLLTCYSALLYLLEVYKIQKTVTPSDVIAMILLTPTHRLEWLCDQRNLTHAQASIKRLLEHYERFLEVTNASEEYLVQSFLDKKISRSHLEEARIFGDIVFEVLNQIGDGSAFYRLLVV
ncbi:MAG TPA: nucleotidyltransferase domain-containing protein [Candidatus Acidoferrales bacterium]